MAILSLATETTAVDDLSTAIVIRDQITFANILDIISEVNLSTMKKKTGTSPNNATEIGTLILEETRFMT
ncbi:hypothetical protein BBAD15_g4908 [Beauveria bassiana D1-5]|uniref:Uncharacterized protein n=1 Tax=Beauveria bassiana D1-5 TaxID=1245745 RepID=A0A0A2VPE5_BEABA|nr:hypothetical protein BBAD15_g4908 [Beauveria bassiana D1-5]